MESRERFTLEKNNRMTVLAQRNSRRGAGRTASGDSEIKVVPRVRLNHHVAKVSLRWTRSRQFLKRVVMSMHVARNQVNQSEMRNPESTIETSRQSGSNRRPADYKSAALPLSYAGVPIRKLFSAS